MFSALNCCWMRPTSKPSHVETTATDAVGEVVESRMYASFSREMSNWSVMGRITEPVIIVDAYESTKMSIPRSEVPSSACFRVRMRSAMRVASADIPPERKMSPSIAPTRKVNSSSFMFHVAVTLLTTNSSALAEPEAGL